MHRLCCMRSGAGGNSDSDHRISRAAISAAQRCAHSHRVHDFHYSGADLSHRLLSCKRSMRSPDCTGCGEQLRAAFVQVCPCMFTSPPRRPGKPPKCLFPKCTSSLFERPIFQLFGHLLTVNTWILQGVWRNEEALPSLFCQIRSVCM